ncbi:MAG: hypothetical protein ACXV2G_04620, partial [Actinomycetes bacterium]
MTAEAVGVGLAVADGASPVVGASDVAELGLVAEADGCALDDVLLVVVPPVPASPEVGVEVA